MGSRGQRGERKEVGKSVQGIMTHERTWSRRSLCFNLMAASRISPCVALRAPPRTFFCGVLPPGLSGMLCLLDLIEALPQFPSHCFPSIAPTQACPAPSASWTCWRHCRPGGLLMWSPRQWAHRTRWGKGSGEISQGGVGYMTMGGAFSA